MMMVPLTMILNDENSAKGYQIGNSVNHLLFMDDLKLYAKNQDDIDALLGLVQEYFEGYWDGVLYGQVCGARRERWQASRMS